MYIKYRDNVIANTPLVVVYGFYPSRCNIIALYIRITINIMAHGHVLR